jgi:type VI secretion system secreted protein Hcp
MPDQSYYLKLDGVQGESRDRYHVGWMKLETFQWGVSGLASPSRSGGGPLKEIALTKLTDGTSTTLMRAWMGGGVFRTGVLELTDAATKRPKARFDFTGVLVTAYNNRPPGGRAKLTDEFALNFASVKVNFNPVATDDVLDKMLTAFGWIK